jgi:hypothetical protein
VRPLLIALALLAPAAAAASVALALAERQVTTLEFSRPVARLATTDPALLALEPAGARLKVTALRSGRAQLEVVFDDGAAVAYEVTVEGARRPPAGAAAAPGEVVLQVGQDRRIPAPGLTRLLLEENGVARARAEPGAAVVTGAVPGQASLVLVDGAGSRTALSIRVVP